MAMDKIQGSALLRQSALESFRKTRDADNQEPSKDITDPAGDPNTQALKKSGDQAIISPAGKQLVDLRQAVDTGRAALAALPDVRHDKVSAARERLANGFYHSAAVRDKVASRLASVLAAVGQLTT